MIQTDSIKSFSTKKLPQTNNESLLKRLGGKHSNTGSNQQWERPDYLVFVNVIRSVNNRKVSIVGTLVPT